MKKTKHIEKLIPLYFYDELSAIEKQQMEAHLENCELCQQRFEETRLLHETLDRKILMQPSEQTLTHARAQLRERLRQENLARWRDPWWQRLSDFISAAKPAWQLAGAAALLAIGVMAGKFVWATSEARPAVSAPAAGIQSPEAASTFISNIDLIEYDPQTGNVTIKYKSISDVLVQGKADDEPIRNLLAYAFRTEGNPGRRLAAVKAVSSQTSSDAELENALIHALENDTVDGVRLRAAQALRSLPMNDVIKKAFIRILIKDPNPSIRIVAVEALSQVKEEADVLPVFQDAAKDDENDFIRLKTSSALERLENPKIEK